MGNRANCDRASYRVYTAMASLADVDDEEEHAEADPAQTDDAVHHQHPAATASATVYP
jgi:hypothetical protein